LACIETNGLNVPAADMAEMEALRSLAGNAQHEETLFVSSIKNTIGHLGAASAGAGFLRTVLSLFHQTILPAGRPSAAIQSALGDSKQVLLAVRPIQRDSNEPMYAGVCAFAPGGTQVHLVLERYNREMDISTAGKPQHLFCWSGQTVAAQEAYGRKLSQYLQEHSQVPPGDIARSLHRSRAAFNARRFVVAETNEELAASIDDARFIGANSHLVTQPAEGVVYLFPGQGSQYLNMGLGLYRYESVFRSAIDECAALLHPIMNEEIRNVLFPSVIDEAAEARINNTHYTQPAIFVVEYALAKLWMSWGLKPACVAGHSVGEFVAALLAGMFSLPEALTLVAARGRLIAALPKGEMLAIKTAHENIEGLLPAGVALAAVNSATSCVVSGTEEGIAIFAKLMQEAGIASRQLITSHAFHSAMMDDMLEPFRAVVAKVKIRKPRLPIISSVTGLAMTDEEATNPEYWVQQIRVPVNFAGTADTVALQYPRHVMLELGPGNTASGLVKQNRVGQPLTAVAALGSGRSQSAYYASLVALGQAWLAGLNPNWQAFYGKPRPVVSTLPTYAFSRRKYWLPQKATMPAWANFGALDLPVEVPVGNIGATLVTAATTKATAEERHFTIYDVLNETLHTELSGSAMLQTFIQLGCDSLTLAALVYKVRSILGLSLRLRMLFEELTTPAKLVEWVAEAAKTGVNQSPAVPVSVGADQHMQPPMPEARLGLDSSGIPGWFISDPARQGKYLLIPS
ncbi:MAG: acyltransferase domain-containing protein, partial [Chitinophagia bacterium]|nr:acyltransferase domain-containing protein [Chitinophagia bacterium]